MITKKLLNELFEYKNGAIYWKTKISNRVKIGDRAGCDHGDGYRVVSINNKKYLEHRVIFMMHYGYLPEFIDHANCDKSNNRIENLREASLYQNSQNRTVIRSKSGFKGVYFDENRKKISCADMD